MVADDDQPARDTTAFEAMGVKELKAVLTDHGVSFQVAVACV
jgi:hypothetical protein